MSQRPGFLPLRGVISHYLTYSDDHFAMIITDNSAGLGEWIDQHHLLIDRHFCMKQFLTSLSLNFWEKQSLQPPGPTPHPVPTHIARKGHPLRISLHATLSRKRVPYTNKAVAVIHQKRQARCMKKRGKQKSQTRAFVLNHKPHHNLTASLQCLFSKGNQKNNKEKNRDKENRT